MRAAYKRYRNATDFQFTPLSKYGDSTNDYIGDVKAANQRKMLYDYYYARQKALNPTKKWNELQKVRDEAAKMTEKAMQSGTIVTHTSSPLI